MSKIKELDKPLAFEDLDSPYTWYSDASDGCTGNNCDVRIVKPSGTNPYFKGSYIHWTVQLPVAYNVDALIVKKPADYFQTAVKLQYSMDNTTFYNYDRTMPDISTGFTASTASNTVTEHSLVTFIANYVRIITTSDHGSSEYQGLKFDLRLSHPTFFGYYKKFRILYYASPSSSGR